MLYDIFTSKEMKLLIYVITTFFFCITLWRFYKEQKKKKDGFLIAILSSNIKSVAIAATIFSILGAIILTYDLYVSPCFSNFASKLFF